ncbi:MAG: STAS domain-containing protein [Oscillatoriales cyanobacterium RU_3_3]|nr:STAS domain-containing protein [Microcoleus sp. SU_5_6]NJL68654.1 STAS domain-containing protein [Microcoleus sp. SM1_3_4]NJM61213.1 STAS domain-containing protein [Oscillatoriales cyanobacterium RU_3_3]NJR26502.1 STAS domain-containing protein [Richelia sp. CSU_2_1]
MQTLLAQQQIAVLSLDHLNAATAGQFQRELGAAICAPGVVGVAVDLAQVSFLDSAGLMALVSGLKQAKSLNRKFSLCSVGPGVRMILELSQLDRVFEIFEDVESFEAENNAVKRYW